MSTTGETALAMAVAGLRVAWPRQDFPDESVQFYTRCLADLDGHQVSAAVERIAYRSAWLPSIAEIREEVAEAALGMPTAFEAWDMATEGGAWPDVVRDTVMAAGGPFTIRTSLDPARTRQAFERDYEARRQQRIREYTGARAVRAPQLTRAERAFGTIEQRTGLRPVVTSTGHHPMGEFERVSLPETDSMVPRPVWARWLRRQEFGSLGYPPTEAEKSDAIRVLADPAADDFPQLHGEAQRIVDDSWHDCASHAGNRCSTPRDCARIGCQL